ncbi:unnamed protein product [Mytilus edulis]|uniref:Uncharacterized protein n=1 Tax=Mytilus edulis TaxID=6550 RepID=A0A8S3T9C5_MYTED|nr:unnamed protein product [Mytilus edulis]
MKEKFEQCITEGSELSLEKAINFARTYELSKAQLKAMESEDKTINMLNKQGSRSSGKKDGKQYTPQRGPPQNNKGQSPNFANKCKNCGDRNVQSVIGDKTCEAMKLLKRIHVITHTSTPHETTKTLLPENLEQQYGDLFTGLGCLPGAHKIRINKTIAPVLHAPRNIPIAIKDKVKAELDRMEDIGVIYKQQVPTQ